MKFSCLCIFLILHVLTYGHQPSYQEIENNCRKMALSSTIDQIMNEQPESVDFYCNHRYYLKCERIQVTPLGIVLSNASSAIPIAALFSDSNGCYLESEFKQYQSGPILLPIICRKCGTGWFYSEFRTVCPRCGTPP